METMGVNYFSAAELPISEQGRIYHLDLRPGELATDIVLVGDPDRVPFLAKHFLREPEVDRNHRGLRTITGCTKESGFRVSIVTSGMGTPSTEIVLQEIVALHEVNFETKTRLPDWPTIRVVRVGTSGALREETPLGCSIIARYGLGLDNAGLYYESPLTDDLYSLESAAKAVLASCARGTRFARNVAPYAAKGNDKVATQMNEIAAALGYEARLGITVSNAGFFASQGRQVARCPLTFPEIDSAFGEGSTGIEGLRFENMEMETSFLFHFMAAVDHEAGAISVALANRRLNTFASDPTTGITKAATIAFQALEVLRRGSP
jgi:uridine phosphorylase